jgi:hypothetical protein
MPVWTLARKKFNQSSPRSVRGEGVSDCPTFEASGWVGLLNYLHLKRAGRQKPWGEHLGEWEEKQPESKKQNP